MIIPVGFAQVSHIFGGVGLDYGAAVVYGVDLNGILDPTVAAEIAHDAWVDNLLPLQTADVTLQRTLCKFGPNATGNFGEWSANFVGTAGGTQASPQVCWLAKKVTGAGGRMGRGRMFIPGITDATVQVDGTISSANAAGATVKTRAFLNQLDTNGMPMTLLHKASSDPDGVTDLVIDGRVATQRRRVRR